MPAFTLALLTAECTNNPAALSDTTVLLGGLGTNLTLTQAFNQAQDGVVVSILNRPKSDLANWTDGVSSIIKRVDIAVKEILEAIDIRDLVTTISALPLTVLQSSYLTAMLSDDSLRLINEDGTDTTILKNIKLFVVNAGQGSQTRVIALSTRPGSRAESLWGRDVIITMDLAAKAGGRG